MGEISWSLTDPQFGNLERLGIAGIAMALMEAEKQEEEIGSLHWTIQPDQVKLTWPDDVTDQEALTPLIQWAWQSFPTQDKNKDDGLGVFWFPAIHKGDPADFAKRINEHSGILWTFLQHSKVQAKTKSKKVEIQIDEEKKIEINFVEPKGKLFYPVNFEKSLFLRERLRPKVKLSSFLFPGATARHKGENSWEGSSHQAIPLFFAPTVCFYRSLPDRSWVIVVPDIRDIQVFRKLRSLFPIGPLDAFSANLADAGLHVLVGLNAQPFFDMAEEKLNLDVPLQCEVYSVGGVAWNRQQVRTNAIRMRPGSLNLQRYGVLATCLPNQYRKKKEGETGFIQAPTPRGPIAENLLQGSYWYKSLFEVPREMSNKVKSASQSYESPQRTWFRLLGYHHNQLREIMKRMQQLDPSEIDEAFTNAFHESMKRLFGREASASTRGSRTVQQRHQDLVDKLHRSISRAQTRVLLREVMSRFFSEAGATDSLREYGRDIWKMIDGHQTWRRARDLALLSLATYPKQSTPQEESDEEEKSE